MHPPAVTWSIALPGGIFFLSACHTVPTKTYDFRQLAFTYDPATLIQGY